MVVDPYLFNVTLDIFHVVTYMPDAVAISTSTAFLLYAQ